MSPLPILLLLALSPDGTQKGDANTACSQAGLVFGVHTFSKSITLKGPTGYMSTMELTDRSEIVTLENGAWSAAKPGSQGEVSIGDLLCVSSSGGRIHVVPRAEVRKRQQAFLAAWQRNSLYGKLQKTDPGSHKLWITPEGSSDPVEVRIGRDVRFRQFASDASRVQDATSFSAQDLRAGEPVYAFGTRSSDLKSMDATVISRGGVRAITGSIAAVDILNSNIRVKQADNDREVKVKVQASKLYRTAPAMKGPSEIKTPAGVPLTGVGFADVEVGDSVMVIGRDTGGEMQAVIVVTAFGSFGVGVDDPSGQLTWLLK